jgi:Tfp pilus assembly protein PilO
VNIRGVKIKPTPASKSDELTTSCTAVTYKFLDEASTQKKDKKKSKKKNKK